MRPTGRLHIGHYFGALQNWVRLQNAVVTDGALAQQAAPLQGEKAASSDDRAEMGRSSAAPLPGGAREYECFYFIADWHALTSDYADTSGVAQNTIEITTDYLAAGLDPAKSVIFQQSLVPEHAELHLLLSMVTPLSWLERVPTYKEAFENVKDKDLHTYGFLGYPCLQTADIVIYSAEGGSLVVPVGEDQVSHVELSREIVRRFNLFYGEFATDQALYGPGNEQSLDVAMKTMFLAQDEKLATPGHNMLARGVQLYAQKIGIENFYAENPSLRRFFPYKTVLQEPHVMLTKTPRIPGLDGRKMSKSYGNAITLSETDEEIRKKTKVMVTDPARKRRTDAGNPDVCPVYDWHKLFSSPATLEWAAAGCRTAGIGCIECKAKMADHLIEWIAPVTERRVEYEKHPARVLEVIEEGSKKARVEAKKTMERVREAVFGWNKKKDEVRK
jgi:tryptophanyl-tRNA synthetase